ncbi:hypothetical protein SLEP1_g21863 [Rubroshorea leprosula]|uniref:Photosystem II protein I n=1 Tax=Rubroshorea leprosula TaxID=152421 RepID=A0AAV5JDD9_9ROSI|nr:hypothetical protein SLEP1_g21863 [Rubroshorea leprosula]
MIEKANFCILDFFFRLKTLIFKIWNSDSYVWIWYMGRSSF